jgi:FtsP/CotA-like multicopper oxidase with cupredoxin domain
VRLGDRGRVRIGNPAMTNHPTHLQGFGFTATDTDGGWIPGKRRLAGDDDRRTGRCHPRLRGRSRCTPGDRTFHCHKSHHTMNAMSHNTRN